MLFLVHFITNIHPDDNMILGIFSNSQLAEQAIDDAMHDDKMVNPNDSLRYKQNRHHYFIEQLKLDEYNFLSPTQYNRTKGN